jgi:hypothetical protein
LIAFDRSELRFCFQESGGCPAQRLLSHPTSQELRSCLDELCEMVVGSLLCSLDAS